MEETLLRDTPHAAQSGPSTWKPSPPLAKNEAFRTEEIGTRKGRKSSPLGCSFLGRAATCTPPAVQTPRAAGPMVFLFGLFHELPTATAAAATAASR